jgi:hypothetical protein
MFEMERKVKNSRQKLVFTGKQAAGSRVEKILQNNFKKLLRSKCCLLFSALR